jgi:PASTA domain
MRRVAAFLSAGSMAAVLALTAGCAAEKVTLPDLVGLPLDEAHRALEKMGFEEFEDRDAFEDRSIMLDANWVVIEFSPGAGESVEIGETITFEVGKRDEARAIEALPEDSPVAQEYAAQRSEERARKEAAEAEQAADRAAAQAASRELLTGYINEIDPLLRLGTSLFAELDATAEGVRSSAYGDTESAVVLSAINAAEAFRDQVSSHEPPVGSKRAGAHADMVAAVQRVVDAARTLFSADGPGRESSLARYTQVRAEAGESWNRALTALYRDTDVPPPLVG